MTKVMYLPEPTQEVLRMPHGGLYCILIVLRFCAFLKSRVTKLEHSSVIRRWY